MDIFNVINMVSSVSLILLLISFISFVCNFKKIGYIEEVNYANKRHKKFSILIISGIVASICGILILFFVPLSLIVFISNVCHFSRKSTYILFGISILVSIGYFLKGKIKSRFI